MGEMPPASAGLVVADPPYLVNYRPRDAGRCNGDDNSAWAEPAFREIFGVLKPTQESLREPNHGGLLPRLDRHDHSRRLAVGAEDQKSFRS